MRKEELDILAIVQAESIDLKQRGRVWWGLCPFHADKNPSFKVDPERGRWHCFACNEGDDAIGFIRKLHHVDFNEARKMLGLEGGKPPPRKPDPVRKEKKRMQEWAKLTSRKICAHLREVVGRELHTCSLAKKEPTANMALEHEASLQRQWEILTDMDDDLNNREIVAEMWANRETVDVFVGGLGAAHAASADDIEWLRNYFKRVSPAKARRIFEDLMRGRK